MKSKTKSLAPFLTVPLEPLREKPLYRQIYDHFRKMILCNEISAGAKLPATRELSAQLNVSRVTVVNAYEMLLAEGYLEGKSGSGTFVAQVLPEDLLEAKAKFRKSTIGKNEDLQTKTNLSTRGRRLETFNYLNLRSDTHLNFTAFHHGLPAMNAFPFEIWTKLFTRRLNHMKPALFGSGDPAGYGPLRRAVAEYLQTARAVKCLPEQVIIVAGGQQALSLITQVLLDENDVVWLENPCYIGAKNTFAAAGAKIVPVCVDEEGFVLSDALRQNSAANLVCVTPSHQYPLGAVMSLPRRLALIEWARRSDGWIIEDDYDGEFRYAGRPLASLQGLDQAGRVIYFGTFSKTIFPALRLGYLVVPERLIDVFINARALADSHSPSIEQAVLTDFIEEGHFYRHLRRMRALYAERQRFLIENCEKYLRGILTVKADEAGMHLVGWLPKHLNDKEVSEKLHHAGVHTAPLSRYSLKPLPDGGLTLGYTAFSEKEITNGIKKIAGVLA